MTHISTRLTQNVELDCIRRERDRIEVVESDGGSEVRNARWSQPLLDFEVSFPPSARDNSVFLEVRNAYRATRGGLHSFRFRDWSDYSLTDEEIGEGDGSTTVFNITKTYTFGSQSFVRRIYNPVSALTVKVDGVTQASGYSIDYATGVLTFTAPPLDEAVITVTGSFDIPVRFEGELESRGMTPTLEHHETIVLREVRL